MLSGKVTSITNPLIHIWFEEQSSTPDNTTIPTDGVPTNLNLMATTPRKAHPSYRLFSVDIRHDNKVPIAP